MTGPRAGFVVLATAGALAATPTAAGEIHGRVPCAERCADFVVHLEGVAGSYSGAGQVVELGQRDKTFIPHVLPLLAGSTLRIGNDDPFLHNVHARREGKTVFNVNLLFQYQTLDLVIAEAGVYQLSCEPHPEMSGFLVAFDHPFFTRPDAEGRFVLARVPPGSYELVSFDAERNRRKAKPVPVGEGLVVVDF